MPHFISLLVVVNRLQKKIYIHHSHFLYVAEFPLKILHCIRGPNPDKLYLINVGIRRMTFTICLKDNLIYYVTTPKTITTRLSQMRYDVELTANYSIPTNLSLEKKMPPIIMPEGIIPSAKR